VQNAQRFTPQKGGNFGGFFLRKYHIWVWVGQSVPHLVAVGEIPTKRKIFEEKEKDPVRRPNL
jgi:hypothetical protein